MDYPIEIELMDCSPVAIDYGYRIIDMDLMAEWITRLLLGNSLHITRIIERLEPHFVSLRNEAIDSVIAKLDVPIDDIENIYRRDGWLFQMMSWISLNISLHAQHNREQIFMNAPHTAPAQHGMDGFALVLDNHKKINSIIITEDKCTENDRDTIRTQVFPEFRAFESGTYDNRVLAEISSIIRDTDGGSLLDAVQNDIVNPNYWIYRIGITRQLTHNSQRGRIRLYKDFDMEVKGNVNRRKASSIYLESLREWMSELSSTIVRKLQLLKI